MKNKYNNLLCVDTNSSSIANLDELECAYVTAFNDDAVQALYKAIRKLESNPAIKVIPILINSYGGSVYSLFAMLDIISSVNKPVSTIAIGKAMSCGAVLLAAGTKGYRYAGLNTDVMIHEVSTISFGKTTELKEDMKNTDRLNNILLHKLALFCGKEKNFFHKKLKERTNLDWYLDAGACKKLGLVDNVGTPKFIKQ